MCIFDLSSLPASLPIAEQFSFSTLKAIVAIVCVFWNQSVWSSKKAFSIVMAMKTRCCHRIVVAGIVAIFKFVCWADLVGWPGWLFVWHSPCGTFFLKCMKYMPGIVNEWLTEWMDDGIPISKRRLLGTCSMPVIWW